MTTTLTIRQVGNSAGVILPKEIMNDLHVKTGDKLFLTKAPDGYRLSVYDAEFAHTMKIAEQVMREDRDVLRKLAE